MEVVEGIQGGEESASQTKKIRLLMASDVEGSGRSNKVDLVAGNQTTSVFLYNNSGQLVRAEIVVDNLNESIVAVPLGTDATAKDKLPGDTPEVLRVLDIPEPTPKKQKSSAVVTVRPVRTQPAQGGARVTKITTPIRPPKHKHHQPLDASPKSLVHSDLPVRVQPKPSNVCTKILIATEVQQKPPHEDLTSPSRAVELSEEQLSVLADSADKTGGGVGEAAVGATQTVMMHFNSLGELELDPVFLATDTLPETHTEESRVSKSEGLSVEEVQLDLQAPAATQLEVGSGNVNQSWFTSREDKEMLRWRGHAWRQGMWSREETDLLQHNIEQYCAQRGVSDPGSVIFKMSKEERSGFYRVIARGLNRPLFSIYRRVIRLYDNHNHIGKYSSEEVNKLRELRMKHGNNWQAIAAHLGRSAASVKDRCRLLNEHCNRGAWSPYEEDRLAAAVYDLAQVLPGEQVTSGISWGEVASRVRSRSEKQCRTKWLNYLNWKRTSGVEWSKADDVQLICRLSVCGVGDESQVDWMALARVWPACRSPHWLRGKWWNLKRRLPSSVQELGLREMCQHLYNQQSLGLLQSTLVELPATFLNGLASTPAALATSPTLAKSKSTSKGASGQQECGDLAVGTIKLCIPAANFSHIIMTDDNEEDFNTRLSGLVQSALLAHSVEVRNCQSTSSVVVSEAQERESEQRLLNTSSQLTHALASTQSLTDSAKTSRAIVVESMEDSLSLHLSAVSETGVNRAALLGQGGLGGGVKEEDILLSDSEGGHTTTLDPSSPVVSSQVILNDPILSVSGEPLGGEEGLQADPDDPHICTGLAGD